MPASDPSRDRTLRGRPGQVPLTLGVFVALLTALLPLLRVISFGSWVGAALLMIAVVLAAGFAARWRRLPAVAVSLIEAGVWLVLVTAMFLHDTALLGVVPTPGAVDEAVALVEQAANEILVGTAPVAASAALSFLVVACAGLLTIVVDHVVVTARMPLVAAVALVIVSLVPSAAVSSAFDVGGFVVLAAVVLFLLRAETRTRGDADGTDSTARSRAQAGRSRPADVAATSSAHPSAGIDSAPTGAAAIAVGIGAVALIVAVVAAPLLPSPQANAGAGLGIGTVSINASLDLGSNLRGVTDIPVLSVTSTSPTAPYLRIATLSQFDGTTWRPDQTSSVPIGDGLGFGAVRVARGIAVEKYRTHVTVQNLRTEYLPVPFPATAIDRLGTDWSIMASNRTVRSAGGTSQGLSYTVTSEVPNPTLQQIEASTAHIDNPAIARTDLPADMPAIIAQTAREVTAGTTDDYDALVALQDWFRGPDFTYSVTAPVAQGFDGSGMKAVADFLRVKKGYCIHFASAFATMARTLGMTARIVVGYLPGTATDQTRDGLTVYSVISSQLHAWPEVYFAGIGWVPFEPTKSLGVATSFDSATVSTPDDGTTTTPTTTPRTSSTPAPSATTGAKGLKLDESNGARSSVTSQTQPWYLVAIAVAVVAAIPGLLALVRRRRLDTEARRGHATAAWQLVQDTAIDLGIAVPATESPRAFGIRLVRHGGAPPEHVSVLVDAIEQESYADGGGRWHWHGDELPDAAAAVRAAMLRSVPPGRRALALLFPRSLVVSPRSAYAGTAPHDP